MENVPSSVEGLDGFFFFFFLRSLWCKNPKSNGWLSGFHFEGFLLIPDTKVPQYSCLEMTLQRNGRGSWISWRKFSCRGNAYIYPRKSTSVPPSGVTVSDIIKISLPNHRVQTLLEVFPLSHPCVSVPGAGQDYQKKLLWSVLEYSATRRCCPGLWRACPRERKINQSK